MVHPFTGARQGVRGSLALVESVLTFHPDPGKRGGEVVIPLDRIQDAHHTDRSPVLRLDVDRSAAGVTEILFYFVEPPFLFGKGAVFTLALADGILHDQIEEWVDAIRGAA
jgi:hypothetical protein